jgi:hypothetical protein
VLLCCGFGRSYVLMGLWPNVSARGSAVPALLLLDHTSAAYDAAAANNSLCMMQHLRLMASGC